MLIRKATELEPGKLYFAANADNSYSRIRNASDRMLNSSLYELDESQVSDTTLAHIGTLNKDDFIICGDFLGYLQQRPIKCLDGKFLVLNESGVMKLAGPYVEVLNVIEEEAEDEPEDESEPN